MNEFSALRQQARVRRDKAIADVRERYCATLAHIAELERDLLGREPHKFQMLISCVGQVIPKDREFTTEDVMAGLEALDPRRHWQRQSVNNVMGQLRRRGILRRLRRAGHFEPAVYVVHDAKLNSPYGDKTLVEVICEVLKGKVMNKTEIAVNMLEGGYRTAMTPKALRHAVGVAMRGCAKFKTAQNGKWRVAF